MSRQKDRKTERQKDRKTKRQQDKKTKRQKDKKTERQKDNKKKRKKDKEYKKAKKTKSQKYKKKKRQKAKTKKRVLYCDIRAVSHSCVVFHFSFGIPFIFTIYFLFLVESFYRDELKGCLYESLESNNEGEEKRKIKPAKSVYSTYQTV